MLARASVVLAAAVLQAGCYNYMAERRAGLVPASYVAVTLTESGSDELARYLGPDVLIVRGRYLGPTTEGLSLSVESVESRRGDIARWGGEAVVVPGAFVRRVEERHSAKSKTALLAGTAVAGAIVLYHAFGQGTGAGVGRSGGGTTAAH
jgi:hypothetical protein